MTWEEKYDAMRQLGSITLEMRYPGNWFCCILGSGIAGNGIIEGGCGNGSNPQQAIEGLWSEIASLPVGKYFLTSDGGKYRWAGYMWKAQK